MSWRTLMKAEIQPAHNFPGPKETSTKYTKPPDPASEHSNQDNFVDIVDETQRPEDPKRAKLPRVSQARWLKTWRELADLTTGVEVNDPRFRPIMEALESCDRAFEQGDWATFQRLAEKAKTLCQKK